MPPILKGLVIGFSIAVPVGPIGLLCLRRSLQDGRLAGFVSGLGAATADALYGVVAALGLTALTHALVAQRLWLQLGGGAFLLYLGIAMMRARPAAQAAGTRPAPNLPAAYASTLFLTLANPMTILAFLGIFAGVGLADATGDFWAPTWLVLGVFLGSTSWWLLLSLLAGWLGTRLQSGGLRALNLLSGLLLIGFGLWQVLQAWLGKNN